MGHLLLPLLADQGDLSLGLLSPTLTGALCALTAFSLYTLSDITVKFLGADYHPAQIVFFSGMAGFPLVVLQMMADRHGGSGGQAPTAHAPGDMADIEIR